MSRKPKAARPRTYRGKLVGTDGNRAPMVFMSTGGKEATFRSGIAFAWGDSGPRSALLALELVKDATDDPELTQRVYRRFLHRVVAQWKPDQPWIIRDAEIRDVIADILRVETESAPLRRMVTTAPAPVVSEGGADVEWSKGVPDSFNQPRRTS